jgi:aspartate aminotransferase-like enzyme
MPGLRPDVDPDGLLEYSVVYTDRALNHMSLRFREALRDISSMLRQAYGAESAVVVPGSGSFAMEAVARQFVSTEDGAGALVLRNGWFSYRWSQILEAARPRARVSVLKARAVSAAPQAPFAPVPVLEAVQAIHSQRPSVVFAPHVETSAGLMLPDEYVRRLAEAAHEVGALFVLDCIASGAMWVDMRACGVDVLVSAPQKGWSGTPCAGFAMLSARALERMESTRSDSFACDLAAWLKVMRAYEGGGHAYHATMPTDSLVRVRDVMREGFDIGLPRLMQAQAELGARVRDSLRRRGVASLAAPGFEAPGVVVSYTRDPAIQSAQAFVAAGVQIAAGVPLACDEPKDFMSFRIGLFGLDKLLDVAGAVQRLEAAFDAVGMRLAA